MRGRLVGSFAVVLIGLVTTLVGGPVFALVFLVLGVAGYSEYVELAARLGAPDVKHLSRVGSISIVAFALAAFLGGGSALLLAAVALAVAFPFVVILTTTNGSFLAWSLAGTGSLYLGVPVFSAIMLRFMPGNVEAAWLGNLAASLSLGWTPFPRGLAWATIVVVATWIADTTAYLAGRRIGGRKLAPLLSPNKTVAGAVAGLVGAAAVGALGFVGFGLGPVFIGVVVGVLLGMCGQLGDLAESFLKRQAGVKDSGTLIPGHGGLLDRIDALLFALPAGFLIASAYDWLQLR